MPVWRELVADTLTPVGAFRAMVGDGPGFLLESVEHGERWSRFSFVGRSPAATLVARGRHVEVTQGVLPGSLPPTRACSPSRGTPSTVTGRPFLRSSHRCTEVSSAISATTSCGRSSAWARRRPTTSAIQMPSSR